MTWKWHRKRFNEFLPACHTCQTMGRRCPEHATGLAFVDLPPPDWFLPSMVALPFIFCIIGAALFAFLCH